MVTIVVPFYSTITACENCDTKNTKYLNVVRFVRATSHLIKDD